MCRCKIRIERLAAIAHVLPVAIVAFQPIFKMDLFRRDQAQRRVFDLQIASQTRQAQVRGRLA